MKNLELHSSSGYHKSKLKRSSRELIYLFQGCGTRTTGTDRAFTLALDVEPPSFIATRKLYIFKLGVTAAKISKGGGARGERGRLLTAKDFPSVGSKRASDSGSRAGASPPRSSQVVGWPPFGSHRMNSLVNNQATKSAREEGEEAGKKKDDETKGILVTQFI
ncbi:hypothetical protein Bca52824_028671 [Brassica carinata]|uniref:Auxin-responsive protein n=1 Tax=Brassica carinata TaxID=52824 RepID=A0A8X7VCY9_BRACI|nr:hypothetical protein Bca52824_028671 [Brassica carinata]